MASIFKAFGLPDGAWKWPQVKEADRFILTGEIRDLMHIEGDTIKHWSQDFTTLGLGMEQPPILAWEPYQAVQEFMARWHELRGDDQI